MSAYPEHDKMSAVLEQSQTIGEFLDWLSEQGITRARFEKMEGWRDPVLVPTHESIEVLLARYFGIDLSVIEAEKRAMLYAATQHYVQERST